MPPDLSASDAPPEKWTAHRIRHLLQERHPSQKGEWAFFAELSNGTGSYKSRSFDAFALNLWPSNRFRTVGYEIKVSRADFAKELEDPSKREALEQVAGECFFAVPAGLVRPDEVPEGWGLIEATAGGLRMKKQPTQRKIEAFSMTFVAALARRSADPEPRLPAAAWEWAGRRLTLADLDQLLLVRSGQIRRRTEAMQQQALLATEALMKRRNPLVDLRNAVVERLGWNAGTADGFQHALDARLRGDLPGEARRRLRQITNELQAVLDGRPSALLEKAGTR